MTSFLNRLKGLLDKTGWTMVFLGMMLFCARLPFAVDGWLNLPLAVTALQTAGLMFTIAGLQIFISRMVWPGIKFGETLEDVRVARSQASATVLFGLFIYNGLTTLAFVIWLAFALGAGIG